MGRRADRPAEPASAEWNEEDDEEMAMDDDDLDLDLEGLDGDEEDDESPSILSGVARGMAWRRIEQAREERLLRQSIADFDEYEI